MRDGEEDADEDENDDGMNLVFFCICLFCLSLSLFFGEGGRVRGEEWGFGLTALLCLSINHLSFNKAETSM